MTGDAHGHFFNPFLGGLAMYAFIKIRLFLIMAFSAGGGNIFR